MKQESPAFPLEEKFERRLKSLDMGSVNRYNIKLGNQHTYATQLILSLIVSFLLLSSCNKRPDNPLEPNDTPAQATELIVGVAIEARANQGNPDVFKIDVAENQTLTFELESLGLRRMSQVYPHRPRRCAIC